MSTMVPGTGPVLTCPTLSRRDCFPPVVATPIAAARLLVQYPTVCEKCCYVFLSELRRLFLRWRWGYLPVRTSREKSEVWLWWVHVRHHAGLPQLTSSHSVDRQQLEPCVVHTCDPVKTTLASNKTKGKNGTGWGWLPSLPEVLPIILRWHCRGGLTPVTHLRNPLASPRPPWQLWASLPQRAECLCSRGPHLPPHL